MWWRSVGNCWLAMALLLLSGLIAIADCEIIEKTSETAVWHNSEATMRIETGFTPSTSFQQYASQLIGFGGLSNPIPKIADGEGLAAVSTPYQHGLADRVTVGGDDFLNPIIIQNYFYGESSWDSNQERLMKNFSVPLELEPRSERDSVLTSIFRGIEILLTHNRDQAQANEKFKEFREFNPVIGPLACFKNGRLSQESLMMLTVQGNDSFRIIQKGLQTIACSTER